MKNLKIDVITNSGFVNLDTEFEKCFSYANSVDIATAFITSSSIKLIKSYLKNGDKQLNLIVGLYGGFNSKKDLLELQKLATKKAGNFSCRISRNPLFHWKYYSFNGQSEVTKFVGSANFTRNGLTNPGELTLKLVGNQKTRELRVLSREFKKLWDRESIDINEFPLSKYKSIGRMIIDSPGFVMSKEIRAILSIRNRQNDRINSKTKLGHCYLEVIEGYVSKETEKSIYLKKSNWQKLGYTFISSHKRTDFDKWRKVKFVLQFELIEKRKRAILFQVMDSTEYETEDGKYFVALKKIRKAGMKQLNSIRTKEFLKSIGLMNNKNQKPKKLTNLQTENVLDFFIRK